MSGFAPLTPFDIDHAPVLPLLLHTGGTAHTNDNGTVETLIVPANPPPDPPPPPPPPPPPDNGGGADPVDPVCVPAPIYNGQDLQSLLASLAKHATERTLDDTLAAFSELSYDFGKTTVQVPSGYHLVLNSVDNATGFQAAAFQNNTTHDVIVAYAGTDPTSVQDLITDAALSQGLLALISPQQWQATAFADAVASTVGGAPIYVTGHSLGGALAAVGAAELISTGHSPIRVSTFGSAPYTLAIQATGNVASLIQLGNITTNFMFSNDVIRSVNTGALTGSIELLNPWYENGVPGALDPIIAHSVKNYVKDGNEITGRTSCSCGCG